MHPKNTLKSINWSLGLGLFVRLSCMVYGIWQDSHMAVKYTDIDYYVFTDAARHVSQGGSPYERATYRYTPLLAWILLPNIYLTPLFGKLLFVGFDILAGWLIYFTSKRFTYKSTAVLAAQMWLFNPLPIGVSSRGNAESIMSVLVLTSLYFMQKRTRTAFCMAFISFAVSIHFKIYPVTYALPYYLSLSKEKKRSLTMFGVDIWPNTARFFFIVITTLVFTALTGVCCWFYGWTFLQETYLHHVTRQDTRHNFSVYFYMFYLVGDGAWSKVISLAAFIPQAVLLLVVSFKYHRDLPFCCFLNTYIFVTFNKVVTSQYFLWYLSILPLVLPNIIMTYREAAVLISSWILAQVLWLLPAYYLEFEGRNTFHLIGAAGVLFFLDNLLIMYRLIIAHAKYCSKYKLQQFKNYKRKSLDNFRPKERDS